MTIESFFKFLMEFLGLIGSAGSITLWLCHRILIECDIRLTAEFPRYRKFAFFTSLVSQAMVMTYLN